MEPTLDTLKISELFNTVMVPLTAACLLALPWTTAQAYTYDVNNSVTLSSSAPNPITINVYWSGDGSPTSLASATIGNLWPHNGPDYIYWAHINDLVQGAAGQPLGWSFTDPITGYHSTIMPIASWLPGPDTSSPYVGFAAARSDSSAYMVGRGSGIVGSIPSEPANLGVYLNNTTGHTLNLCLYDSVGDGPLGGSLLLPGMNYLPANTLTGQYWDGGTYRQPGYWSFFDAPRGYPPYQSTIMPITDLLSLDNVNDRYLSIYNLGSSGYAVLSVPEPSTLALLALLAGLELMRLVARRSTR
jgi:hypothetical protein